jgi:hypothetical protein
MSSDPSLPSLRSLGGKSRVRHDAKFLAAEKFSAGVTALRLKRLNQPFRFADLPVELKKMVYSFHADEIQRDYEIAANRAHENIAENFRRAREERRAQSNPNNPLTRCGRFEIGRGYSSESSSESDDADEGLGDSNIANPSGHRPLYNNQERRDARRDRRDDRSQRDASRPDKDAVYEARHRRHLARYRRRLANFHVPSLAQVSQEIRQDLLEVVFKEGAFDIVIGSLGVEDDSSERTYLNSKVLTEVVQNAKDPNDFLHLRPHVVDLLGQATIFQDVRFVVYEAHNDQILTRRGYRQVRSNDEKFIEASSKMRFQWLDHKLRVRSWPGKDNGQHRNEFTGEMVDGGLVLAVREVCMREGFKGFTVADLRRLESLMVNRSRFRRR